MPSSSHPRSPASLAFWLAAAFIVIAAMVAVTQFAGDNSDNVQLSSRNRQQAQTAAATAACPATRAANLWSRTGTYVDARGATQHIGDGQVARSQRNCVTATLAPTAATAATLAARQGRGNGGGRNNGGNNNNNGGNNNGGNNNGGAADPADPAPVTTAPAATTAPPAAAPPPLDILANDCSGSELEPHDGFQNGNRCVSTEFGEVGDQTQNPTLLITDAPRQVDVGEVFNIDVSTQNLIRDRFLAAGQGGYYVESSLLNDQGLVRGHFHTACRMLASTSEAPDPEPVPAFFVATEDGGGGNDPDTVQITVAGMPTAGTAQCAVWAGDGSHRVPMMQRANQIPAFDVVRVEVR